MSKPERTSVVYTGPARHPEHSALVLHGLGYVNSSCYAGRQQFHWIAGARAQSPWPLQDCDGFRDAFEEGADVLAALCVDLLGSVDADAAEAWRAEATERGDPSVCDAFSYPALPPEAAERAETSEQRVAMSGHLDPGWFTVKQGSLDGGLEVFDRTTEAWVNVEEAAFHAPGGPPTQPGDAEGLAEGVVVIFAGERLETWTEGGIPAVPHRALSCRRDRLSFIFELRDHAC